jgi:hypothetical protein
MVRGMLTRKKWNKKLQEIPHCVEVDIDFGTDLPKNNDFFGSLPDVFVLANVFKKLHKGKEQIKSSAVTQVVPGTIQPIFREKVKLTCTGKTQLVLNVMSQHSVGQSSLLGQCRLDLEKHRELYNGKKKSFKLPLEKIRHDIYEHVTNEKLAVAPPMNLKGYLSVTIGVPNIFKNMCGYFYQLEQGVFDIKATKIWVVLDDGILNIYDSPYDRRVKDTIDTSEIADMEECEYDKIEINIPGVKVKMVKTGLDGKLKFEELMWGWGDDASKTKALWRHALINHVSHEHYQQSVKQNPDTGSSFMISTTESSR